MVLGWMMGTDPLVLEFQASVNKPFINFPALWRVSVHMVLEFCSPPWEMFVHCPSHCLLIDNFTVDRLSAFQRLCNPFPSPACPFLHLLLTLCILLLSLGCFSFPLKQTQAGRKDLQWHMCIYEHIGERGVAGTIPSMCPPSLLIISSVTPSLSQPIVNTPAMHPCCLAAICWVVGTVALSFP